MNVYIHHVNRFIDDNVLDLAHLNESGRLPSWGVAGGHLYADGANDKQGLVVYLNEVDVKHHAHQGDEYGAGEYSSVLQERENICMLDWGRWTHNIISAI